MGDKYSKVVIQTVPYGTFKRQSEICELSCKIIDKSKSQWEILWRKGDKHLWLSYESHLLLRIADFMITDQFLGNRWEENTGYFFVNGGVNIEDSFETFYELRALIKENKTAQIWEIFEKKINKFYDKRELEYSDIN